MKTRKRRTSKQSVLEVAARDHNWLLGRVRAAEVMLCKAMRDALDYANAGYYETCRRHNIPINQSTYYTYERAVQSMSRSVSGLVRDRFNQVKFSELSRDAILEPTQDYQSPTSTSQEPTAP